MANFRPGSSPVIRVSGKDSADAVKLLKQHDAHQLVWPGRRAECELELGAVAQALGKPVGAADDETNGGTVRFPPFS